MTADEAKELVEYMQGLRKPAPWWSDTAPAV